MLNSLGKLARFFRARWRWMWGYCPRCNRNLHAAFPNHRAGHPNCPVCKDETESDLRVWHKYRSLSADPTPLVAEGTRPREGDQPEQHSHDLELAKSEDRWRDDGGPG
jgi:hypothetical protein